MLRSCWRVGHIEIIGCVVYNVKAMDNENNVSENLPTGMEVAPITLSNEEMRNIAELAPVIQTNPITKVEEVRVNPKPKKKPDFSKLETYKRNGGRKRGSWSGAGWQKNDLTNIPPIAMDDNGIPRKPRHYSARGLSVLTEINRMVHFLMWFNWSSGNLTKACQEAGIRLNDFKKWKENPEFNARLKEIKEEIADRLLYRIVGKMGLLGQDMGDGQENSMIMLLKTIRPDLFHKDIEGDNEENKSSFTHHISRPRETKETQ